MHCFAEVLDMQQTEKRHMASIPQGQVYAQGQAGSSGKRSLLIAHTLAHTQHATTTRIARLTCGLILGRHMDDAIGINVEVDLCREGEQTKHSWAQLRA